MKEINEIVSKYINTPNKLTEASEEFWSETGSEWKVTGVNAKKAIKEFEKQLEKVGEDKENVVIKNVEKKFKVKFTIVANNNF